MTALQQYQNKNNISLFTNTEASGAIKSYLKTCTASQNTRDNYTSWFNHYFMTIVGKDINNVTWSDIETITYSNVATYQNYLITQGNCANTINKKFSAIETMLKFFMKKYPEQNIDVKILSSVELKVSKHDIKSHGILKDIEVKALLDYCDNISYKPAMQRLFFETMFITALRHDACLNLTTDQIKHIEDPDSKQMVYVIKQTDKSKARDIAISDSLTERLLKSKNIISEEELLKDTRYDFASNRIFTLSEKAITKTLKQFCKSTNISEDRNISLHSIRNATCNYALKQTNGNITETAKYMGHSSIKTTFDFYTDQSVSYTNQLSITLHDNSISTDELSDLTKEELLDLISKAGNGIVKQLIDLKKGLKK